MVDLCDKFGVSDVSFENSALAALADFASKGYLLPMGAVVCDNRDINDLPFVRPLPGKGPE